MAVFNPNVKIDLTDFVISSDDTNLLSMLLSRKTSVTVSGEKIKFVKSVDLYSSFIEYIVTDEDDKIVQPRLLSKSEIRLFQHAPYTITPEYITKRVYGTFAITIDVTPDEDK